MGSNGSVGLFQFAGCLKGLLLEFLFFFSLGSG
jgi:hypothetical protein